MKLLAGSSVVIRHWIAWPSSFTSYPGWRAGGLGQALALGDQDLRAHDVDAGDLLGHGVLDLHAGVHLDEVEGAGVHIHQELDRARALVVHVLADLLAQKADLLALGPLR
jgi:hypothetical protein